MEEFIFNKWEVESEVDLEGSTLFLNRYKNQHDSLDIRFCDVGKVKF